MTEKIYPRSPFEKLGGLVHLPRLIDKARLARDGLLQGYNYKTSGFDRHLLAFLGIDGDDFESVANELMDDQQILQWIQANGTAHSSAEREAWNEALITKVPDTPEKKARFQHILAELGGDGRESVKTYFDLIEFEERREAFLAKKKGFTTENTETKKRKTI
jgi:Domain of unknown function (DUF5069)